MDERRGEPVPADTPDPRPPLRIGAAIALVAALFLLPLQASVAAAGILPTLFLIYAIHTAVSGGVLALTFTRSGARRSDALTVVLVLGLTANLLLYLYLLPDAVPTYPALMSNAFTVLLIGGAVLFAWSTRRMIAVGTLTCAGFAAVAAVLVRDGHAAPPFVLTLGWLAIGAGLAAVCAGVLGRFRSTLLARQEELSALSTRLMAAQDEQLHHLSHELHDELGQSLTAVSSYLRSLEQQLPAHFGDLRERVAEARRLVAKTVGEMREISQGLRPPGLDLYGLGPSLEGQLKAFGERHRLITHFSAAGLPDSLPVSLATAIYRIAQEALSNVARHAHARHVNVALQARAGELQLDVQDDGVGLPAENGGRRAGTGLIGVRERVRALGGTATIVSASGTLLSVTLPLPSDDASGEPRRVELAVEPAPPLARRASPN